MLNITFRAETSYRLLRFALKIKTNLVAMTLITCLFTRVGRRRRPLREFVQGIVNAAVLRTQLLIQNNSNSAKFGVNASFDSRKHLIWQKVSFVILASTVACNKQFQKSFDIFESQFISVSPSLIKASLSVGWIQPRYTTKDSNRYTECICLHNVTLFLAFL